MYNSNGPQIDKFLRDFPCTSFYPSWILLYRAAWKNLDGLPQDAAKLLYIDKVHKLLGDTEDFKEAGAGPVISTLGDDALEAEEDVPVRPVYLLYRLRCCPL